MKKKDMATTLGIVFGTVAIVIGMALNNGKLDFKGLRLFWDLPSIFITVGGSFFTILICYPMDVVKKLPGALKTAFFESDPAEARTQDPQIKSLQAGSPQQE